MYVVPICRLCLSFMYGCFHRSFIFVVYVCRKEDDGEGESGGTGGEQYTPTFINTLNIQQRYRWICALGTSQLALLTSCPRGPPDTNYIVEHIGANERARI